MSYNVRIDDNFLRADHVDGEVLQHTDMNELESVAKTAINANYEDIQKLQDGTTLIGNSEKLDGATLSKYATEALQNSDTKVPTSQQVKQYVDGEISNIDLSGYYTKRQIDDKIVTEYKDTTTDVYSTKYINENIVDFADYADQDLAGVIKLHSTNLATMISPSGYLSAANKTYEQYLSDLYNTAFISKGTLETVLGNKTILNLVGTEDEPINLNTITSGIYLIKGEYTIMGESGVGDLFDNHFICVGDFRYNNNITIRKVLDLTTLYYYFIKRSGSSPYYNYNNLDYPGDVVSRWDLNQFEDTVNNDIDIIEDEIPTKTSELTNDGEDGVHPFITSSSLPDLTDYIKNTDYATASKGGVIKSGYYGLQVDGTNGKAYCDTYSYANYGNVENQRFISKGTLENVITGKGLINNQVNNLANYYTKTEIDNTIGDINSALDSINGEVI